MSRITSFEILAPRSNAEQLVQSVIEHLVEEDKAKLWLALETGPEPVMQGIECEEGENDSSVCMSFLFSPDEGVKAFEDECGLPRDPATGRVEVGYIFSSLSFGSHYVQFQAASLVDCISEVFLFSPSVRGSFIEMAKQVSGAVLVFCDELSDDRVLWCSQEALTYARKLPADADTNRVDVRSLEMLNTIRFAGNQIESPSQ
ncbi:MAG: hypothetical protein PHH47_10975 [Gallionella sp.]|nr:hypothetical protein [Gallionella sp.]MDD4946540.1 hypothetical protein [Gallionella sp.]